MALTSRDETDLLLPLQRGLREASPFATFLERLQRRTQAEHVAIVIRKADSPLRDATTFFAGIDLRARADAVGVGELHSLESLHHDRLRPGRVYAVAEFVDHDPAYAAQRGAGIERLGIVDERVVRISGTDEIAAWLIIARAQPCTAADSALLSNLAPYVGAAIETFVAFESRRVDAAMASEGLRRSGAGWILLDREANVLSADPLLVQAFKERSQIRIGHGQRLANIGRAAADALSGAARMLAGSAGGEAHSVVLSETPRIEALLVSANGAEQAGLKAPACLALCRFARAPSRERKARLAQLFDLPPREAELAIALADGLSLADAAAAMGLTIETARNYSKRLFAALDVTGQPQLVRKVFQSSAMLA